MAKPKMIYDKKDMRMETKGQMMSEGEMPMPMKGMPKKSARDMAKKKYAFQKP